MDCSLLLFITSLSWTVNRLHLREKVPNANFIENFADKRADVVVEKSDEKKVDAKKAR